MIILQKITLLYLVLIIELRLKVSESKMIKIHDTKIIN